MIKINYLVSHPIYYQIPQLNFINESKYVHFNAYYYKKFNIDKDNFDKELNLKTDFLKKKKINFYFKYLNSFSTLCKYIKSIFNKNENSIFIFHGWNSIYIILSIFIIKIFTKKKIYIRGENVYKDKNILIFYLKYLLFKLIDYFLYIGTGNKIYYESFNIKENNLIPLLYSSGITDDEHKYNYRKLNKDKFNKNLKLIFIGKIIQRKNIIMLTKNLIKFNQTSKKKINLDICGDGELFKILSDLVKDKDEISAIKLLGFLPNDKIKKKLYNYDFIILPSLHENWGLVINEAMENKLPILLSDMVGSKYDLLINGLNGFTFTSEYKSIEKLFNTVNSLSKQQLKLMGENSFKIIRNFTVEKSSEIFLEHIKSISKQ